MINLRRLVPVSLLAAAAVMLPQAALAHDELISSDPADGSTVQGAPDELALTFSGQIAEVGAAVNVTDSDENSVADGDPEVEGTTLVQDLDDLAAGDYEVVWRVTSQDGHPISGTFGFAVEVDPAADDAADDDASDEDATDDAATDDAAADDAAGDDATGEATDEATEDAAEEATEDATDEATEAPSQEDESVQAEASGMPAWAWVVIGLGVVGLAALLARTWSRNRT